MRPWVRSRWVLRSALRWARAPGPVFQQHVGHHLPVTLLLALLAAALTMHPPGWLRPAVVATTAVTLWVDDAASRLLRWAGHEQTRFQQAVLQARIEATSQGLQPVLPLVTVLSLDPDAHARFLGRASPTPRLPMACVLLALQAQLSGKQAGAGQGAPPPRQVLAIDVDLSTVLRPDGLPTSTPDMLAWRDLPGDGLDGCRDALWEPARAQQAWEAGRPPPPPVRRQDVPDGAPGPSIDHAMRAMLRKLAGDAEVVAIHYPRRLPQERLLRDRFITNACCRPPGADQPGSCVPFVSPQLTFVPGELVFEFPDVKRTDPVAQNARPDPFPGLGQAIAEARQRAAPVLAAALPNPAAARELPPLCRADDADDAAGPDGRAAAVPPAPSLPDRLVDPLLATPLLQAYSYADIDFGSAVSRISYYDLKADVDRPDKDVHAELAEAVQNLDHTGVVVLTVNAGTAEDQFRVPVASDPVPGAWVHAAVALTLIKREHARQALALAQIHAAAPQPGALQVPWDKVAGFSAKVFIDVLLGLVFAFVVTRLAGWVDRAGNPVGQQVVLALAALVASVAVQLAYLRFISVPSLHGGQAFYPPLMVLLGLSLHVFFEALGGHGGPAAASAGAHPAPAHAAGAPAAAAHGLSRTGRRVQWLMQWLFGCSLFAALVWAVTPVEAWPPAWTALPVLLAGTAYLVAARRLALLPLPWRHP